MDTFLRWDYISHSTFHSDPTTSHYSLHDRHIFRNKREMNYGKILWQCTYRSLRLDKSLEIGARKMRQRGFKIWAVRSSFFVHSPQKFKIKEEKQLLFFHNLERNTAWNKQIIMSLKIRLQPISINGSDKTWTRGNRSMQPVLFSFWTCAFA